MLPPTSIPMSPLQTPVKTQHNNPHRLSPFGPAYVHSKALFCSSSQSQNLKFSPTHPKELTSVTPSGKSSIQQLDIVKFPSEEVNIVKYPSQANISNYSSQEASIDKYPQQEAGIFPSPQRASTTAVQNTLSSAPVPHLQQSHSSWSPGSDADRMKEEEIVREALAFLKEHMKKKTAVTDTGSHTLEEESCSLEEIKKHQDKDDERKGEDVSNPPNWLSAISFSEDKKNSVMDASIQELSTLLLECQDGPGKDAERGENAHDPVLVDLTDSADVLNVLLKPPSQSETIPKYFPYAMPLDVEVLHSVKEEGIPRVKDVSFIAEDPSLQSEIISKHLPRWFSNPTSSNSSDEEGEMEVVEEANQKKRAGIAEIGSCATFIVQDELLVQGFIISEAHSLAVSSLSL